MERAANALKTEHSAVAGEPPFGLQHVAIIMDGNGRWAKKRGLPRTLGHHAGVEALRRAVRAASDLKIRFLTIYSFSSENWSRPAAEVADLLGLLRRFIRSDIKDLDKQNVRVRIIGERASLPADLQDLLGEAEATTAKNTGLTLLVAFNYGARQEIVQAARRLAEACVAGTLRPEDISDKLIAGHLYTADIPDPELIIRTSGEQRLSNFLMWQAAYSEFVFTPVLWPDFDKAALEAAIMEFGGRQRRFGGL